MPFQGLYYLEPRSVAAHNSYSYTWMWAPMFKSEVLFILEVQMEYGYVNICSRREVLHMGHLISGSAPSCHNLEN